jgi:subtilase family serine protease
MHRASRRLVCALGLALIADASWVAAAPEGRTYVGLRGRNEPALRALLAAQQDPGSSEYRRWLGPLEFGTRFGAAPRDLKRVERWLRADGCRIRRPAGRQQLECVGARPGAVPPALAPLIDDVIDLEEPVERQHHVDTSALRPESVLPTGELYFTPGEYADFYGFTALQASGIDGAGQRIGIVSTVPVVAADIAGFRALYGLPPLDLEQVGTAATDAGVDDRVEAALDVTWSGAVAPGAAVVVSISSGTLVDAISYLVNRTDVSVMSLSVDFLPSRATRPLIRQALKLFKQAAAEGKTVLVASGDFGPLVVTKPKPRRGVSAFAQSPFVTAVGGTTPSASSPADVVGYGNEVVWQDGTMASGGGRSTLPRPTWQRGLKNSRRTVPDVSLAASGVYPIPENGAVICCVAGTSGAAPSWAGLIAMLNQQRGTPAGLLNPKLYELGNAQAQGGTAVFFDIVLGSNSTTQAKGFRAKPGYDLATGWGSPNVTALFSAFQ